MTRRLPTPQHQHRAFGRQQGPQLCGGGFDHGAVPLVQQAYAGDLQRHIPAPRPRQPLPRDLYPGDRHAALTGRCHAHPGGQGGFARLAEQFIGKVSFPHFASPIRLNFRIWALFLPKRYQKYGKMKKF